jgi:hypothetical protein
MRDESFEKYISNLKREDNSIWKPIKNRTKPKTSPPPIHKYSTPLGPWAKSDKETADYLQNIFPKFSLHIIMIKTWKWNKTWLHPFNHKNVLEHLLLCFKRNKR